MLKARIIHTTVAEDKDKLHKGEIYIDLNNSGQTWVGTGDEESPSIRLNGDYEKNIDALKNILGKPIEDDVTAFEEIGKTNIALNETTSKLNTFLDGEGLAETVDTLQDIQQYINEHGTEAAAMSTAITDLEQNTIKTNNDTMQTIAGAGLRVETALCTDYICDYAQSEGKDPLHRQIFKKDTNNQQYLFGNKGYGLTLMGKNPRIKYATTEDGQSVVHDIAHIDDIDKKAGKYIELVNMNKLEKGDELAYIHATRSAIEFPPNTTPTVASISFVDSPYTLELKSIPVTQYGTTYNIYQYGLWNGNDLKCEIASFDPYGGNQTWYLKGVDFNDIFDDTLIISNITHPNNPEDIDCLSKYFYCGGSQTHNTQDLYNYTKSLEKRIQALETALANLTNNNN